ncbi:unnamed protein product [Ectocarpus sp. 13 AM-2016]
MDVCGEFQSSSHQQTASKTRVSSHCLAFRVHNNLQGHQPTHPSTTKIHDRYKKTRLPTACHTVHRAENKPSRYRYHTVWYISNASRTTTPVSYSLLPPPPPPPPHTVYFLVRGN